jgi:hypothetical protein
VHPVAEKMGDAVQDRAPRAAQPGDPARSGLRHAPGVLRRVQDVGEPLATQEIDAHERRHGGVVERIADLDDLAGEGLRASVELPVHPRCRQLDHGPLALAPATLRQDKSGHRLDRKSLRDPPLDEKRPGLLLLDLDLNRLSFVRGGRGPHDRRCDERGHDHRTGRQHGEKRSGAGGSPASLGAHHPQRAVLGAAARRVHRRSDRLTIAASSISTS